MKKTIFFLAALMLIFSASFAQEEKIPISSHQNFTEDAIQGPTAGGSLRALPTTPVWSEGFESATFPPTGWTRYGTNYTRYTTGGHNAPACFGYGAGSSSNPTYGITTHAFTPTTGATLSFWTKVGTAYTANANYYTAYRIKVSTTTNAQASFTTIKEYSNYAYTGINANNVIYTASTTTFYEMTADLSAYNGQSIYVAIEVYDHYGDDNIRIDDIALFTKNNNDLALKNPLCPVTQIPTSQFLVHPLSTRVENIGVQPQTNVQVSATWNATPYVAASVGSLASGAAANVTITPTAEYPVTLGSNTLTYTLTPTDDDPSDNTVTHTVTGTTNIYAMDIGGTDGWALGSTTALVSIGNIFTITRPTKVSEISCFTANWGSSPYATDLTVSIYAVNNGELVTPALYTSPSQPRPSSASNWADWMTVAVANSPTLLPGNYFVCTDQLTTTPSIRAVTDGSPTSKEGYFYNRTTSSFVPITSAFSVSDPGAVEIRMTLAPADPCTATAPTGLTATPGTGSVTLSWTGNASCYKLTVNNGTTNMFYYLTNTTYTLVGLQTVPHTWSVTALCESTGNPTTNGTPFTPLACTAISTFPWSESFEATTLPPFPPACWTSTSVANTPWKRVTTGTDPTCTPHSGAGMLLYNCYDYAVGSTGLLITPPIDRQGQSLRLKFWMYRDAQYTNTDHVKVHINASRSLSGATLLGTIYRQTAQAPVVAATGWYEYAFSIPDFSGENYIIFEGVSNWGNNIYVDDISIIVPLANDLAAVSVTGNLSPMALLETNPYTVTVRNEGLIPTSSSYVVKVLTEDDELLGEQTVTTVLAPLATTQVAIPITFPQALAGILKIKGVVEMTGDENPANDETPLLTLNVKPHPGYVPDCSTGVFTPIIGTGTLAQNYTIPTNNNWDCSYTQQIFTATEIGVPAGTLLSSITFYTQYGTGYTKPKQSVYLGNVGTKTTFSSATDYIPASQLQLVYDDKPFVVASGATTSNPVEITITFDTPYIYEGGNLVVVMISNQTTANQSSSRTFRTYPTGTNYTSTCAYKDVPHTSMITPANVSTYSFSGSARYQYRNAVKFKSCGVAYTLNPNDIYGTGAAVTLAPDPVPAGTAGTVTIDIDDPCYYITSITVNGDTIDPIPALPYDIEFQNVNAPLPQIIITTSNEYDITLTTNAGGTVTPDTPTITLECGEDQTYTYAPNTGYHIASVLVDGTPNSGALSAGTYTFSNIGANHTIAVTFEGDLFTLFFNPNDGTVDRPSQPVTFGSAIDSLPYPERDGFGFVGWFINGVRITDATVWDYLSNQTAIAVWGPMVYTLTFDPLAGGTSTYTSKEVAYHTAIGAIGVASKPGCQFLGWFVDGTNITPATIWNWTRPKTAVARYYYPIVATNYNPGLGTMSPTGTVNYLLGDNATYTCTPNTNAYIAEVIVDGVPQTISDPTISFTYDFDDIDNAHTISVRFAVICFPVLLDVAPGINVTTTPANCVPYGGSITYSLSSAACYNYVAFYGTQPVTFPFTINNVTDDLEMLTVTGTVNEYTIEATAGANGTITDPGITTLYCGETMTYHFGPDMGYFVSSLLIDGAPVAIPASLTYTFSNVRANHTIHVEFADVLQHVIDFGPVTAQNAGGVVFPVDYPLYTESGFVPVDAGTDVEFMIIPDAGYVIDKVYVDGAVNPLAHLGQYTFYNVTANHTIFATFKATMFTITATTDNHGVLMPGTIQVAEGATQTFMAIPTAGYVLENLYVDGVLSEYNDIVGGVGFYTFVEVMANHTIHATFAPITYEITATAGAHGTINPAGVVTVNHGDNKTFTFTPAFGYDIDQVLVGGVNNPAAALAGYYTFMNVTQDEAIHVTFKTHNYTITASCNTGGTMYPLGVATVPYNGHSETYVFNPNPGYHVKQVLIDHVNDLMAVLQGEYRFLNVNADHLIQVFFAPDNHTIAASATQGGVIDPAGLIVRPDGADQTFFFGPHTGYDLVRVMIDGINDPDAVAAGYYTFTDLSDSHIIAAHFEKKTYTVSLPVAVGAHITPINGSVSPVAHGGKFMFVVDLEADYNQSVITIRSNGLIIAPVGGVYTLDNIVVNQEVTIEGVVENPIDDGIGTNNMNPIQVFSHQNVVTIMNKTLVPVNHIDIMDMYGRIVWQGKITAETTTIPLDVATGIYGVRIATENDAFMTKVSIIR